MMPVKGSADRTAGWGVEGRALRPWLLFSVGQQSMPACLLGGRGVHTGLVIPKRVRHEISLLIRHAAFEGPAGRDTICSST